jgi:hydrogenase maturation protease
VVIGVGNEFRRDGGAGHAVVAKLRDLGPPGVELVTMDGEPTRLIEAWTGAALAVVVDAVRAEPPQPGDGSSFRGGPAGSEGVRGCTGSELAWPRP